jgi:hypothetical protein
VGGAVAGAAVEAVVEEEVHMEVHLMAALVAAQVGQSGSPTLQTGQGLLWILFQSIENRRLAGPGFTLDTFPLNIEPLTDTAKRHDFATLLPVGNLLPKQKYAYDNTFEQHTPSSAFEERTRRW